MVDEAASSSSQPWMVTALLVTPSFPLWDRGTGGPGSVRMVGRARRPAISFDMACRSCWSWVRWSERREEGLSIGGGRVAAGGLLE